MLAWYQTCRPCDGAEELPVTRRTMRADVLVEGSRARDGPDFFYVAAIPDRMDASSS